MRTTEELARETDPTRTRARLAIRRMVVKLTNAAIWQLTGFRLIDGTTETIKAEVFGGIGIAARPPATGSPEAITAMVGDANQPVVVALRDEATRKAVAGALKVNESMLYNGLACVHVKDDATIEARSKSGTAVELATKADIDALRAWLIAHVHTAPSGGGPTTPPTGAAAPTAAGTSKFKAE